MRYSRHVLLDEIGEEGQKKLNLAKVLVVGAGGLGCPCLQYLTAAGIGKIGIVDGDVINLSNLQRQILFATSDVGKNKAETAQQKLKALNPEIEITAYPYYLTTKNALDLFAQYDIIVDGTDNFSTRYLINDASIISGKPLVSASIFKFSGQLSVFNFGEDGASYRCLFPTPPNPEDRPSCSEIGVLGVLPGIIGSYQANEVIKLILSIGKPLINKILQIDTLSHQQMVLNFVKNKEEYDKAYTITPPFEERDYQVLCNLYSSKGFIQIENKDDVPAQCIWMDVREKNELPKIPNSINIPLSEFSSHNFNRMDKTVPYLIFCSAGIRSLKAISQLQKHGFEYLYNLTSGILS
jgi:adenylyltransferase/sulfurtransferase